jgi:hypothetical protein
MSALAWPLRWLHGLLAATTPRPDPHGPVWVQPLGDGRYRAGCRECGCGETFGDAEVTRLFLAGHRAGVEAVAAVTG